MPAREPTHYFGHMPPKEALAKNIEEHISNELSGVRQGDRRCQTCESKWGTDCRLNGPILLSDEDGMVGWPAVDDNDGCMHWKLCEHWDNLPICQVCLKRIPPSMTVHHHGQEDRCDRCEQAVKELKK